MSVMPAAPPPRTSLGTVEKPAAPQANTYTRATTDIQVIRMWLHRKSSQTVRAYSNDISAFFAFTGCTLAEVRLEDVQAFADEIAEELAPSSQKRRLAAVKSLLSFANKIGYIPFNVGAAVDLPKPENRLPDRILSEAKVQKMIDAASTERDRALLQLLYNGGLRVSEAAALRWRHLQPHKDAGVLTTHGKGSKTRSVLLSAETWQTVMVLRKRSSDDAPVFRSQKGGPLSASQIYRIVKEAAMNAGIEKDVSPHWLSRSSVCETIDKEL